MNLSQAIGRYVAMKQLMGISFKRGRDVLEAFSGRLGELPLRSVLDGRYWSSSNNQSYPT
jgi:hypothetical protein